MGKKSSSKDFLAGYDRIWTNGPEVRFKKHSCFWRWLSWLRLEANKNSHEH